MNITKQLTDALEQSLKAAKKRFNLEKVPSITLEQPPRKEFGDFSTNVAMQVCKLNHGLNPNEIALFFQKDLNAHLKKTKLSDYIKNIEIKPPAFINIFLSNKALYDVLFEIEKKGLNFGKDKTPGKGKKAIIEFVSANPTGPLTVAHARQAAIGAALSNILEFFSWEVCKEYYLNDEGNQIAILAASIYARYAEIAAIDFKFPEDGYKGEYIKEIAQKILDKHGKKFTNFTDKEKEFFSDFGMELILKDIKKDLSDIGVVFDNYTSQKKLSKSGKIEKALDILRKKNLVYEKDGATWFRSTAFNDDKDRVLIKSNGSYTYITPDIAYHKDKFNRGFSWLIDIWGPDHHGYINRIKASQKALGEDDEALSILIAQLVTIYRGGKQVRMSTRAGEFITLREILNEIGPDVAKFFFLTRKNNTHLDFDLELAKSESMDNPVYYIQYAHARICGILEHSEKSGTAVVSSKANPQLLKQEQELALLKKIREYPNILYAAYETLEPYRIIDYVLELSKTFHSFYTKHQVVSDDSKLTQARLFLVKCVKIVISDALGILGISHPEKM